MSKKERTWRKVNSYTYEHVPSGKRIIRETPPVNGHYSLWIIVGETIHEPTLREAKERVERAWSAAPAANTESDRAAILRDVVADDEAQTSMGQA